jgi:hypothetical protein
MRVNNIKYNSGYFFFWLLQLLKIQSGTWCVTQASQACVAAYYSLCRIKEYKLRVASNGTAFI